MKQIIYRYSNGKQKIHTCYIKPKTILKESEGSEKVDIYEKNIKLEKVAFGITENQKEYV